MIPNSLSHLSILRCTVSVHTVSCPYSAVDTITLFVFIYVVKSLKTEKWYEKELRLDMFIATHSLLQIGRYERNRRELNGTADRFSILIIQESSTTGSTTLHVQ